MKLKDLLGFLPEGFAHHLARLRAEIDEGSGGLLAAMRAGDAAHYMPGAVLAKVDRMSMQHSLEVRTPFLNVELARFAERLPGIRSRRWRIFKTGAARGGLSLLAARSDRHAQTRLRTADERLDARQPFAHGGKTCSAAPACCGTSWAPRALRRFFSGIAIRRGSIPTSLGRCFARTLAPGPPGRFSRHCKGRAAGDSRDHVATAGNLVRSLPEETPTSPFPAQSSGPTPTRRRDCRPAFRECSRAIRGRRRGLRALSLFS